MAQWTQENYQYTTANNANMNLGAGAGTLGGIFVSSASNTPLLCVQDASAPLAANGNAIVNEFVPVAATYYRIPAHFNAGLSVRIGGNVVYTVLWNK
jgi:hypothetical protein